MCHLSATSQAAHQRTHPLSFTLSKGYTSSGFIGYYSIGLRRKKGDKHHPQQCHNWELGNLVTCHLLSSGVPLVTVTMPAITITVTARRPPTLLPPSQVSCQALPWHRSQARPLIGQSSGILASHWPAWLITLRISPRLVATCDACARCHSTWASQIIRDIKWARDKSVTWVTLD